LPALWRDLGVASILDIPCGDFAWMQQVDLSGFRYIPAPYVAVLEASDSSVAVKWPDKSLAVWRVSDIPDRLSFDD
jgi:hypothetical protein